ncbi:MAG: dTMP kinase [Pseudomonadota bacterium]
MSAKGRFITLEGGEGTGKSTLMRGLVGRLQSKGITVLTVREPGGTPLAEDVRSLALKKRENYNFSGMALALLMHTARDDLLEREIRPALRAGHWVLCDRFADSTRVYQGIDGAPDDLLDALERNVIGETQPDLTLILDGPPDALLDRRSDRGLSDVFEARDLEFHNKVRRRFLNIADTHTDRCVVIDALQSPENVLKESLAVIDQRFSAG